MLIIQFRAVPLPRVFVGREWAERLHRRDGGVPYGIALAAAALLVYPHTEWMAAVRWRQLTHAMRTIFKSALVSRICRTGSRRLGPEKATA